MLKRFVTEFVAVLSVLAHSAFAGGPYSLTSDGSGKSNVAFDDAKYWQDANGGQYNGGTVFDPDGEYFVVNSRVLHTHSGWQSVPDTVFNGKSLTLGSISDNQNGLLYISQAGKNFKISFSKLILERGEVNHNYLPNSQNVIDGPVEVRSKSGNPFKFVNYYTNCTDTWTGDFSGESDAVFMIGGAANGLYKFLATGNWAGYSGRLIIRKSNDSNKLEYDTTYRPQTSSSFPGVLALEDASVMSPLNATDVITVNGLELSGGSKIVVAASAAANSRIVVNGAFSQTGVVALDVSALLPVDTASGRTATILTVPATAELDEKGFRLDDASMMANGYLVVDGSGGNAKSLKVVFNRVVSQTVTDSSASVKHQQTKVASSLFNGEHWSDGATPHEGVDYIVKPDDNNKAVHLFSPESVYEFKGDALTFRSWCYFYLAGPRFTSRKLVFEGSNNLLCMTAGVNDGSVLDGGVVDIRSTNMRLGVWKRQTLRIDSEITGSGDILINSVDSTGDFGGNMYLAALNTNFTGTISVSMYSGYSPTADKCQTLFINDGRNLGGACATMNYKALSLSGYGRLATTNAAEVVLAGGINRGVYVDGIAQIHTGCHIGNDTSLVLKRPLTLNGELLKDGSGTLVLDSDVLFGEESSDVPVSGANRLTVNGGSVEVGENASVDGIEIKFTEGTALVIKVNPENREWIERGVFNVKSATPFVLGDNVDRLPVKLDLSAISGETLVKGFTCAIATVSASAADSVASMLYGRIAARDGISPGFVNRMNDAESNTVTFTATFKRVGLVISVK